MQNSRVLEAHIFIIRYCTEPFWTDSQALDWVWHKDFQYKLTRNLPNSQTSHCLLTSTLHYPTSTPCVPGPHLLIPRPTLILYWGFLDVFTNVWLSVTPVQNKVHPSKLPQSSPSLHIDFRPQHSTIWPVLRPLVLIPRPQRYCWGGFLDVSQAFGRVWHMVLYGTIKVQTNPVFRRFVRFCCNITSSYFQFF